MQTTSLGMRTTLQALLCLWLFAAMCVASAAQDAPAASATPTPTPPVSTEPAPTAALEPPTQPVAARRLRIDPALASLRILYRTVPEYPAGVPAGLRGPVALEIVVAEDGTVREARATAGDAALHGRAVATVQQWRFTPYLVDGEAVEFETSASLDFIPGNNTPRMLATATYQAAYNAFRKGAYEEALKAFRQVLQYDPKFAEAWNEIGRIHLVREEFAEAVSAFEKELKVNPNNAHAHNNLGLAHWLNKEYAEGIAGYREQLRRHPKDVTALANIGLILEEQKEYAKAVEELERAAAVSATNTVVRVALANCYCQLKQDQKCTAVIEAAAARQDTAENWNAVASAMAARGLRLEDAQKYALRAVNTLEMLVGETSIERVSRKNLQDTYALAGAWHTLGRIYMQRDDVENAERYLRAAWILRPENDLLAQLLEKIGKKEEALYCYGLSFVAKKNGDVKRRLAALGGSEAVSDESLAEARQELAKLSSAKVGIAPADYVEADFYVVTSVTPGAARWIAGNESLKPLLDSMRELKDPAEFPGSPVKGIPRRVEVACMKKGEACSVRFLLPKEALARAGE